MQAYKVPKQDDEIDELTEKMREKGVAPQVMHEYHKEEVKEEVDVDEFGLLPIHYNGMMYYINLKGTGGVPLIFGMLVLFYRIK